MKPRYEKLEQLMAENNERPVDVSRATGVSQSVLSDWKRGVCFPKVDKLMKIAEHFGVAIDEFIKEPAAVG